MIQSPIKRKHLYYPKDFIPNSTRQSTNSKRFSLNQQYHIDANAIKKYDKNFQYDNQQLKNSKYTQISMNPQNIIIGSMDLSQESPLDHHMNQKRPDLNEQILKKPRFCIKKDDQIAQNQEEMQYSSSPGFIKRQIQNRQIPLPLQDPCKIELIKPKNNKSNKVPNQVIMFKSTANQSDRKWYSNEKNHIQKFKQSRTKGSLNEFPQVNNKSLTKNISFSNGKQIYDSFRKKQQFENTSKINTFLSSMKTSTKQVQNDNLNRTQFPKFEPSNIQKLKQQINQLMSNKRKILSNKQKDNQYQNNTQQNDYQQKNNQLLLKNLKNHKKLQKNRNIPQYMISYRSSLSFLKDLHNQTIHLNEYRLIIKIPKLFTEDLIYKNQDKTQLYQISQSIFSQLKINYDNLIIKRYTNCIMMISRHICMIWYFDGKRYLGGWQTQYLDQGCKHGLGLQWEPKHYVYYGQFMKNKKQGLGVYKDRQENMFVGYWKKGKYISQIQDEQYQHNQYSKIDNQYLDSQENQIQNNYSNYQYL